MEFYELLVLLIANIIITGIVFFAESRSKISMSNIHSDEEEPDINVKI